MKKDAFKSEGIELRYREKAIGETQEYSVLLDEKINPQNNPRIYLHNDGQLYFYDNTLLDPIPLSKMKSLYDRIKVEGDEIRFYKSDFTGYVTLTQLNKKKVSLVKNNSMLYTESKIIPNRVEVNVLEQVKNAYYSESGNSSSTTSYDAYYSAIALSGAAVVADFIDDFTTNLSLRGHSDEGYYTPLEFLVNKYVRGLTTKVVTGTGIYTNKFYFVFDDATANQIIGYPTTLNNMDLFFNSDKIGFSRTTTDMVNSSKVFFGGKPYSDFEEWMNRWLYEIDGVYPFIHNIFNAKGTNTGKVYDMNNDNGYTTTTNTGNKYAPDLQIDNRGYFYDTVYYPIQEKVLKSISKAISQAMRNEVMDILETEFISLGIIEEINGTYYFSSSIDDSIVQPSDLLDLVQEQLTLRMASSLTTTITTAIGIAMGTTIQNFSLPFGNNEEIFYGGDSNIEKSINVNYQSMVNTWFDIEDFYVATPPLDNTKGVAVNTHFNITVADNTYPSTIEFRLYESTTGETLDTCRVQCSKEDPAYMVGDYVKNSGTVTMYPVSLCYYGPISQYDCELAPKPTMSDSSIKVWEHPVVTTTSKNCATGICINEEGGVLKELSENIFASAKAQVIEQNKVVVTAPRIYRVQWRFIPNITTDMPQNEDLNVFSLNTNTNLDEYRMNISVYNLALANNQRKFKQKVETFTNQYRKQVLFNFPMDSMDYSIALTCSMNIRVWFEQKSQKGFVIVAEREFTGEVSWIVGQQPILPASVNDDKSLVCCVENTVTPGSKSNFELLKKEGYYIYTCLPSNISVNRLVVD
jgi:hypothetical protein